jgi:hypothetical protein
MTQQDKDREAFDSHIVSAGTKQWGQTVYDEHWKTWQAAREHFAPKLTEREAVEIVLIAFDKAYRSGDTYVAKNFIKGGIAALRAAGVRFKEKS